MQPKSLPRDVVQYAQSPIFDETNVPAKLTSIHNTKSGVWGLLRVLRGQLEFVNCTKQQSSALLHAGEDQVIAPEHDHYVALKGPVRFQIDFYR